MHEEIKRVSVTLKGGDVLTFRGKGSVNIYKTQQPFPDETKKPVDLSVVSAHLTIERPDSIVPPSQNEPQDTEGGDKK